MKSFVGCVEAMEVHKPYVAMLFVQCVYSGMALFSKAAISAGMNPPVFVFYRQAFATLAMAPLAFSLERSIQVLNFTYTLQSLVSGCDNRKLTSLYRCQFAIRTRPRRVYMWARPYLTFFFSFFFFWQKEGSSSILQVSVQSLLGFSNWVCDK